MAHRLGTLSVTRRGNIHRGCPVHTAGSRGHWKVETVHWTAWYRSHRTPGELGQGAKNIKQHEKYPSHGWRLIIYYIKMNYTLSLEGNIYLPNKIAFKKSINNTVRFWNVHLWYALILYLFLELLEWESLRYQKRNVNCSNWFKRRKIHPKSGPIISVVDLGHALPRQNIQVLDILYKSVVIHCEFWLDGFWPGGTCYGCVRNSIVGQRSLWKN